MRVPGGPNPIRKRYGLTLRQSILRRVFKDQVKSEIMACVRAADHETIKAALETAQRFSSGRLSYAELARAGHPYARRAPNPAFNPSVINRHTGKFFAGWKIKPASPDEAPVLWNTARVGVFLEHGTKFMVARPVDQLILTSIEPIRIQNLDRAFKAGVKAAKAPTLLRPAAS